MIYGLISKLSDLPRDELISEINKIKIALHEVSPFNSEPVDCVLWVKNELVAANGYNPNSVAPPEMKLLEKSIVEDGYTQPIVTFPKEDGYEVVDGFHRSRVGKESKDVKQRVLGYVPVVRIRESQGDINHRMASTIRHNRARGKHSITSMSDIVIELKKRNWSEDRIGQNLGMDSDEVLRLLQINGLENAFKDREFSDGWEYEQADDDVDLETSWPSSVRDIGRDAGWHHSTDKYSYLIGEKSARLGSITKSRFNDEWFVYVYTDPMTESRQPTKEIAMKFVESFYE